MKRILLVLAFAAALWPASAQPFHADWMAEPVVAFTNVNVVPMDTERVLPGHTVIVRDGRITAVGPAGEIDLPGDAYRIDGSGKYLVPGMAEMHGHLPGANTPRADQENSLFLFVANGVTTVRGMQGAAGQLELREQAARGEIVSPTLYVAGPGFSGGSVNFPEQARAMVAEQAAAGWDLLKVLPGLTQAEYDAMADAAQVHGIRFAGHVPADVGLMHAIERGQDTFDHIDGYVEYVGGEDGTVDAARLAEIVQVSRASGVAIVPTMAVWENLFGTVDVDVLRGYEELKYLPPAVSNNWIQGKENQQNASDFDLAAQQRTIDARNEVLQALHEGDVTMIFGTDAPQQFSVPGFSFHHEYLRMLDAGFTPYEILKSATVAAGDYFRGWDSFGTVAVGKRADLVLVNGNPLESIHNMHGISGVMVRGRWLPKDRIDARLAEIEAAYRQ